MPEIGQIIKLFVLSILVVMGLQVNVGGDTIENHMQDWIHSSKTVGYFKEIASGGVVVLQDAGRTAKNYILETINGKSKVESASRFNLKFNQKGSAPSEERELRRAGSPDND